MAFEDYQEQRALAEAAIKKALFDWCIDDAPEGLEIGHVRKIIDVMVAVLNGATRRCYDIGRNEDA